MRPIAALTPLAAPLLGVPAAVYGALPTWALLTLLGVTAALTATQVVVTQIIRLRASARKPGQPARPGNRGPIPASATTRKTSRDSGETAVTYSRLTNSRSCQFHAPRGMNLGGQNVSARCA